MTSRIEFDILMKMLADHGLEIFKMIRYENSASLDAYCTIDSDRESGTCFLAAPFIIYLFNGNQISDININELEEGSFIEAEKLDNNSFKPMKITWFKITDHEFDLIYINMDEIYLIDYYQETGRNKLFRIIKFKNVKLTKELLTKALFDNNYQAYKQLFDIQDDNDFVSGDHENFDVQVLYKIYNIPQLPTYSNLRSLFLESLPLFEQDKEEAIEILKKRKDRTLKKLLNFKSEEYMERVKKFDKIYKNYLENENKYYDVL